MFIPGNLYKLQAPLPGTRTYPLYLNTGYIDENIDRIALGDYENVGLMPGDIVLVCSNEKLLKYSAKDSDYNRDYAQLVLFKDKVCALNTRIYNKAFKVFE